MTPNSYLWLVPVLPLSGAAINGFFGRRSSRRAISTVALFFCGAAFAMALFLAAGFSSVSAPYYCDFAHWIRSGSFRVDFSLYLDQL
jgi:NADH-quinone oxidoreductase subunit L